jgi:hypothetical protein
MDRRVCENDTRFENTIELEGRIMKNLLLALGVIAVCGSLSTASATSTARASAGQSSASALLRLPRATPAGQTTVFGHIKSLAREGGKWKLRFDPAMLLFGATAEQEAFEQTGSRDVPNDSVTFDETHQLLTYVVAPTATVTIVTQGLGATTISVGELSKILVGKNPAHRKLFGDPKGFGFWMRVGDKYPNPVLTIDEQYHP